MAETSLPSAPFLVFGADVHRAHHPHVLSVACRFVFPGQIAGHRLCDDGEDHIVDRATQLAADFSDLSKRLLDPAHLAFRADHPGIERRGNRRLRYESRHHLGCPTHQLRVGDRPVGEVEQILFSKRLHVVPHGVCQKLSRRWGVSRLPGLVRRDRLACLGIHVVEHQRQLDTRGAVDHGVVGLLEQQASCPVRRRS